MRSFRCRFALVLCAALAAPAFATHSEPAKARKVEAPIIEAQAECTHPNVCLGPFQHPDVPIPDQCNQLDPGTPCKDAKDCRQACKPAVRMNPGCHFGLNGHGEVKAGSKRGDMKLLVKMYDVQCDPGTKLGLMGNARLTLHDCARAACTADDFEYITNYFALGSCDPSLSTRGECKISIPSIDKLVEKGRPAVMPRTNHFLPDQVAGLQIMSGGLWQCADEVYEYGDPQAGVPDKVGCKQLAGVGPSFFAGLPLAGPNAEQTVLERVGSPGTELEFAL